MVTNSLRLFCLPAMLASLGLPVFAQDDAELQRFQGQWMVTELVEDGKVIPQEAIREWLPSGGRIEIASNAIIFQSPSDGKKHVKVFGLDPAQYPKQIDVSTREQKDGWGIYQFDKDRLVICMTVPAEAARPDDFSAKEGSHRMRMVWERVSKNTVKTPVKAAEVGVESTSETTPKVLTDAEMTKLLNGKWQTQDSIGALIVTLSSDGSYNTVRQVKQLRLFQQVFVQTPVSSGTWNVEKGRLRFHVSAATDPGRVNKVFDFQLRSVSQNDFIFIDYFGITGRAIKQP